MPTGRMRNKEDIEFHQLGYGYNLVPAVNVKVYDSLTTGFRQFVQAESPDPEFTEEWIEENVSDDRLENIWMYCCEIGWEDLQGEACEIYGNQMVEDRTGRHYRYRVYSEGRSGGWAYIDGINTDVESWDAIEFTQWKRFAKFARERADSIMYDVVWHVYENIFQVEKEEKHDEWLHTEPDFPEAIRA